MARHESNGRYVIKKKENIEIIKDNKRAPNMNVHIRVVDGRNFYYSNKPRYNLADIITEHTFKQTYQIYLEIQYPFEQPQMTLIWQGNRLMQDLYAFYNP